MQLSEVKDIYHTTEDKQADRPYPNIRLYSVWVGIFLALVAFLYIIAKPLFDWRIVYAAAHDIHHYEVHRFYGLPHSLLLVPHAFIFSLKVGNAINLALILMIPYFVVRKFGGDWKTLLLVYTFPPYLHLVSVGNIDWLPLLAWLSPPGLAVMFALVKPQVCGAMSLILFKRHGWRVLIPISILGVISLFIWGLKPIDVSISFRQSEPLWNMASVLFPYFVPVGLYLLYKAYRTDNLHLAALSSVFFVPYIALYSFGAWFIVLACYYRPWAIGLSVGMWIFVGYLTLMFFIG